MRSDDADYVVSEVLDQLVRTVAERNRPPENLAAWSRSTARWKWADSRGGRIGVTLGRETGILGTGDVHDEVARRVDMESRPQQLIGRWLQARAQWYATLTPPCPDDVLTCRVAAHLVTTRQVELLEATVRGLPDGVTAVRAALALHAESAEPLSPGREGAVIRVVRDMLRRHLDAQT